MGSQIMAKSAQVAPGRRVRHLVEAAGLYVWVGALKMLPIDLASNLGGALGRAIGPRLGITRRARRSLRLAFPAKTEAEIEAIVRGMWDNLGRTAAEYPHLGRITAPGSGRIELIDLDDAIPLQQKVKPGILVSGHLANWEIMHVVACRIGIDLAIIERSPNNPYVRRLLERLRGVAGGRRIPKGSGGAKDALKVLRAGGTLGILADQKMSDGIEVRFFGRSAMTAAGPAQLALRTGCPLVPSRIERIGPARFRMTCYAPLELPSDSPPKAAIAAVTQQLNDIFEDWIRQQPADWLWLHRRWPKAAKPG